MFGMLKGLVGSKSLSREDMESVLDKMRDHLIAKNVAADIAVQLCESVASKLEGKVMGTFSTVTSTVKQALQESLVQILQPQRRVDMLRDIMDAQRHQRPYVVTFCGVNGVGKSTNLAKISFWLLENGFSVLIAACDTFRAGAVEQLRTHTRRLSALHPQRIMVAAPWCSCLRRVMARMLPALPWKLLPLLVTKALMWCWWTQLAECKTMPL